MAKTKSQIEYAQTFFKSNPEVKTLWGNAKGEFFTDLNWANNSFKKDTSGKITEKLEVFEKDTPEGAAE